MAWLHESLVAVDGSATCATNNHHNHIISSINEITHVKHQLRQCERSQGALLVARRELSGPTDCALSLLCFCFALQPVDMKKMFGGLGAAKKKPAPAKPVAMDAAVAEVLAPIQSTRPGHRHHGTHMAERLPLRANFFLSSNGSTGRAYNCRSLASINPRPPKPLALRRPTPPPPDPAVSECVSAARCRGRNRRRVSGDRRCMGHSPRCGVRCAWAYVAGSRLRCA